MSENTYIMCVIKMSYEQNIYEGTFHCLLWIYRIFYDYKHNRIFILCYMTIRSLT